MKSRDKDLFGYTKTARKPHLELVMLKHDRETLAARIERLQHLQRIFPKDYGFLSSLETAFVFDEAKTSYINGQFVATILLAQAYIKHKLQDYVANRGESQLAKAGPGQDYKVPPHEESSLCLPLGSHRPAAQDSQSVYASSGERPSAFHFTTRSRTRF